MCIGRRRPFRAGVDHDRARRQYPTACRAGRRARSCAEHRPRGAGRASPRRRGMSSLKDLQESFQRGILAGDDTILAEIKDSAKEERKVLFGVYRHAYVARLAEVSGRRLRAAACLSRRFRFRQVRQILYRRPPVGPEERAGFRPPRSGISEGRRRLRQASRACRDRAPGEGAGRCLRWARRRAAEARQARRDRARAVGQAYLHAAPHGDPPHLHDQRRRYLVRLARGDRPAAAARCCPNRKRSSSGGTT